MISQNLINAYKNTTYSFFADDKEINIRVGEYNQFLEELLEKFNSKNWIFITAYNPYSCNNVSELENENKQKKLKDELKEYIFFEGAGIADNQDWQPEKSLFVLNIDIKKADYLMEKYQQNAIVIGSKSKIPELKFNRLLCQ